LHLCSSFPLTYLINFSQHLILPTFSPQEQALSSKFSRLFFIQDNQIFPSLCQSKLPLVCCIGFGKKKKGLGLTRGCKRGCASDSNKTESTSCE
ncbi:hypothetical protein VIGAN_08197000, partial [Vigna angularis var. angularis]